MRSAMATTPPVQKPEASLISLSRKLLKNPHAFDNQANQELLKKFADFRKSLEHGWVTDGLDLKIRKNVDARKPLSDEVYAEIVEKSFEALKLKMEVENWGRTQEIGKGPVLGTFQSYFQDVYLPLQKIALNGKYFPKLRELEIMTAIWPEVYLDPWILEQLDSVVVRAPAATLPAGGFAQLDVSEDPTDFPSRVDPELHGRLKELAELLKGAAERNKKIQDLKVEFSKLDNGEPRKPTLSYPRGGRTLSPAQKASFERKKAAHKKNLVQYEKDLAQWKKDKTAAEAALDKAEPHRGFWAWTGRKVGMLDESNAEVIGNEINKLYADAARLTTVQLMLKQIYFYKEIIDDPSVVDMEDIAPACREAYSEIPAQLRFQFVTKEERLYNIETSFANNGMIFSETELVSQDDFNNFYLNDAGRHPGKGNLTGMMPFHMMRVAQQGKLYATGDEPMLEMSDMKQPYEGSTWKNLGIPAFDDLRHFNDVFQVIMEKALPKLEQDDIESFNKVTQIIAPPASIRGSDEEIAKVFEGMTEEQEEAYYYALDWHGFTPYLADKLIAMDVDRSRWLKAIPRDVFGVFTENKINVDFPPFYGPESYKQWALRSLYKALRDDKINSGKLSSMCKSSSVSSYTYNPYGVGASSQQVDTTPRFSKDFCSKLKESGAKSYLESILKPFEDRGPYVPPVVAYDSNLRRHWGELRKLWQEFRSGNYYDSEELPAKFNEWTFIQKQFGRNPWVMLRVSAMSKLWELENGSWPPPPPKKKTVRRGRSRAKPLTQGQIKARDSKSRLKKALKVLPLVEEDIPVQPMYANSLIVKNEENLKFWKDQEDKRLFKLWEKIENVFHRKNMYTYKLPPTKSRSSIADTYGMFEFLQRKSFFEKGDVKAIIKNFRLSEQGVDTAEMYEHLGLANSSHDSKKYGVLKAIMDSPGEREKHEQLLENYIFQNGDDETFSTPKQVKLTFLNRNRDFKWPLMMQVMKSAAKKRIDELKKDLQPLCKLDPDDDDDWDTLMSMTARTQRAFNEEFGMEAIPESVMKFYDRTTDRDKRDYKNMGLMVLGFIGLMLASAACASGVGSLAGCPLAAQLAMITVGAVSVYALAKSSDDFIRNAVEEAGEREERMAPGNRFKEMGFTDAEAVNRRKGRGYYHVAFEVVTGATMFLPVGMLAKATLRQSTRTVTALVRMAAKQKKVSGIVDVARTSMEVTQAHSALKALKITSKVPSRGSTVGKVLDKAKHLLKPSTYGKWAKHNFYDDIVVDYTPKLLDDKAGEQLAKWFTTRGPFKEASKTAGEKFGVMVSKDVVRKLTKLEKLVAKHEKAWTAAEKAAKVYGESTSSAVKVVKWATKPQYWFKKSQEKYVQKLAKHFNNLPAEAAIDVVKKQLARDKKIFAALGNDVAKMGEKELAAYLSKHMGSIAPMMQDFTFHWWRLPSYLIYVLFFQGTPYAYPKIFGRWFARRAYVKQILASREKLISLTMRREGQEFLEQGSEVMGFDLLNALHRGQAVLYARSAELGARNGDKAAVELGTKIRSDWFTYRKSFTRKLFELREPAKAARLDELEKIAHTLHVDRATRLKELKELKLELGSMERQIFEESAGDLKAMRQTRELFRTRGWFKTGAFRKSLDAEKLFDYSNYGESVDILMDRLSKETDDMDSLADYVVLTVQKIKMMTAKGQKTHEVIPY